jgi:hypothetical protein
MDEKTQELRDIFIDATGSDTVTERQEESRGSLTDEGGDESARLHELIGAMRERYDFESGLGDDALETVVRGFYDEYDDAAIADAVNADPATVFHARMDLHLVRESDTDAPFDLDRLRGLLVDGADVDEAAADLDADPETVAHYAAVVETRLEAARANDRFRDEFVDLLTDAALSESLARDAREDGLREATEDIETDVSF